MKKINYDFMSPRKSKSEDGEKVRAEAELSLQDCGKDEGHEKHQDISIVSKEQSKMNGPDEKPTKSKAELMKDVETEATVEEEIFYPHGCCSSGVEKIEHAIHGFLNSHSRQIGILIKVLLFLAYLAYFGYSVQYRYYDEGSYILTAITALLILKILSTMMAGPKSESVVANCLIWFGTSRKARIMKQFFRYGLYILALILLCLYLGLSSINLDGSTAQALMGIFCLILVCFLFSASPSQVNWHPVFWGFIIQFFFATLTLRTDIGYSIFKWIGDLIHQLVRLSDKGSIFVFGDSFLAEGAGFFFDCAGVIVFFNSLIFLLEYLGILEFIVLKIGGALALCLETGPVESVVAAANIFIGLSEAPLLVRPYLGTVTKSELHAIMVCGFSSISGAFMAMFIKVGAPASHLLTAAVISAPAALAITKLMYPERERVDFASQQNIRMKDLESQKNGLQAFSDGAAFSIKLVATIMVNMIAFVSLLNLVDTILMWAGDRAGVDNLTFEWICSYVLYPVAFLMGVPAQDCRKLGSLLGVKLIATPFVAYADLGLMIQNRRDLDLYMQTTNGTWHTSGEDIILDLTNKTLPWGIMAERSEVISTYALCGISAFPAIGFSMGTLIPMSPERKGDIVNLIIRAFIAGNLANIVTGAVAGVMYTGE